MNFDLSATAPTSVRKTAHTLRPMRIDREESHRMEPVGRTTSGAIGMP